jgi:cyclase
MIRRVREICDTPLIASGGAGDIQDFPRALAEGADALLAASVFHFGIYRISDVKDSIRAAGYVVRERSKLSEN